jgi:hypothetical protein
MRPDLQGLRIPPTQLDVLSRVRVNALYRPTAPADLLAKLDDFKVFWGNALGFATLFFIPSLVLVVQVGLWIVVPELVIIFLLSAWRQWGWIRKTKRLPLLITLLEEVDRYNAIVKAIEINDQLEDAGNLEVRLSDRRKVLDGLRLTRVDLVRALKTERILRENQQFIALNAELFSNNLSALTALQVSEKATEQGRLLNEALQIAVDVQQEMRKLQNRLPD